MEAPKFKHDCDKCTFLGHFEGHDLYICLSPKIRMSSLVARYSDVGWEYQSTIVDMEATNQIHSGLLKEALKRAKHEFANLFNWNN